VYRVMIVEDEPLVRIGMKNIINWDEHGLQVVADEENGRLALNAYTELSPDIVITDLKMPLMSGMELMREIRKSDSRTRFIIITCFDEFALVKEAMTLDVSAYILKLTSSREEIEAALKKACDELDEREKLPLYMQWVNHRAIQEQILRDYLVYGKIPVSDFKRCMELLNIRLPQKRLYVIMLRLLDYEKLLSRNNDPLGYRLCNIVVDLLQKTLDAIGCGYAFCDHMHDFVMFASFADFTPEQEDAVMDKMLVQMKEGILQYLNAKVLVGISQPADGCENLPALREQALDALDHKVSLPIKLSAALDYLSKEYMCNISIQDAADYVGLTPNYLGHLFLRYLGNTFTEQLNGIRIEHAKALLSDPKCLIYEVGSMVGLINTTYFTRLFRRYTGQTPSEYRKALGL